MHNTQATKGFSASVVVIAVIVVVVIGTVLVLDYNTRQQEPASVTERKPAPAFALADYEGNTVRLSDSDGKVRLLNSWATWCPFCVDELPDFVALQEEFGDDIVVISINREESRQQAQSYTDDLGISDDLIFLLDPEDSFYRAANGFGMPITLFVDGNGNTVITKRGPMDLDEMREKTLAVLEMENIAN